MPGDLGPIPHLLPHLYSTRIQWRLLKYKNPLGNNPWGCQGCIWVRMTGGATPLQAGGCCRMQSPPESSSADRSSFIPFPCLAIAARPNASPQKKGELGGCHRSQPASRCAAPGIFPSSVGGKLLTGVTNGVKFRFAWGNSEPGDFSKLKFTTKLLLTTDFDFFKAQGMKVLESNAVTSKEIHLAITSLNFILSSKPSCAVSDFSLEHTEVAARFSRTFCCSWGTSAASVLSWTCFPGG